MGNQEMDKEVLDRLNRWLMLDAEAVSDNLKFIRFGQIINYKLHP